MAETHAERGETAQDLLDYEGKNQASGGNEEVPTAQDDEMGDSRDRAELTDQPAAKRPRRSFDDADRKRGQRLMGNLLGTLAKFKEGEKARGSNARVKQRDEIAQKVAQKLQSETARTHEITTFEKEIKTCRIEIDRMEIELKQRELLIRARAKTMPRMSRFLMTSSPRWNIAQSGGNLPLSLGPARDPRSAESPRPLYYEQKEKVRKQEGHVIQLIEKEEEDLAALRVTTADGLRELRSRLDEARVSLAKLRGNEAVDGTETTAGDEFGRAGRDTEAGGDTEVPLSGGARETEDDMQIDGNVEYAE